MEVNKKLCIDTAFVDKKSFLVLSPEHLYKWKVKNSECIAHFPATRPCSYKPFTCLSWKFENSKKHKENSQSRKGKKLKSETLRTVYRYTVGTAGGDILLVDEQGERLQVFSGAHCDRVNCITWSKGSTFYSCSDDMHIAEWDVSDLTHKWKWKAGKSAVTRITIESNSNTLISSGKFIKIWDLKTKQLLKKLSTLKSPVSFLSVLNPDAFSSMESQESLNGIHVFSASCDEKHIKILQVGDSKHKKCCSRSISFSFCVRMFEVYPSQSSGDPIRLLVLTSNDQIHVFSHVFNGNGGKPIAAIKTIRLMSQSAAAFNIISARFKRCKKSSTVITAAYGSTENVGFQNINLEDFSEADVVVTCKEPEAEVKIQKKKKESADVIDKSASKRKRRKSISNDMTSEHPGQLKSIMTSASTATFSQLCEKLSEDFQGNASEFFEYVHWVKEVMQKHVAQIEKLPFDSPVWVRLQELSLSRHRLEGTLPRLQGSLDLVMSQILQKQLGNVDDEALHIYEDESSDEMEFAPYDTSDAIEESDEIFHNSTDDESSGSAGQSDEEN